MTACIIFFRFRSELRVEQRNVLMIMMPSQDFLSWQGVRTYQHDRSLALIDGYPTAFCELEIIRAPTMVIYRLSTRDPCQHIFLLEMY